jgi:hypothetical protein
MDNYFILSSKSWGQVGQSSSQHDKCQVGDMHTYGWDLVHLAIILLIILSIIESSSQSSMSIHTSIEISFVPS